MEQSTRICVVCKNPLSIYNKSDRCFHHSPQETFTEEVYNDLGFRSQVAPLEQIKRKKGKAGRVTTDIIINVVAEAYDVPKSDLLGRCRKSKIAWARHVAMYLIRIDLEHSFLQIAEDLKRRDHTTVIYACKKVGRLVEEDDGIRETIKKLRTYYRAG